MHIPPELAERLKTIEGRLYTLSLDPGYRVYGERTVMLNGEEWREWSLSRSKPAAYLALGGKSFPLRREDRVLYLGAASGTTASHFSDILDRGTIYCVEISQRPFRNLVSLCNRRGNMVPILGDASHPATLRFAVDKVDFIYQDVAQKGQARIFTDNMMAFNANRGVLVVKARSEDVTAAPIQIFKKTVKELEGEGMDILECIPLEPYERDHAILVVKN